MVTRGYSWLLVQKTLKSLNVFVVTRVYMLVNMFQVPFWRFKSILIVNSVKIWSKSSLVNGNLTLESL